MSPNLRRYGAMAVAVGLLVASAGSVHAQGFGVIPNQPFVNNPNSVPNIQSSGSNPRKTANSAHFVRPISACNSYGFAMRLS